MLSRLLLNPNFTEITTLLWPKGASFSQYRSQLLIPLFQQHAYLSQDEVLSRLNFLFESFPSSLHDTIKRDSLLLLLSLIPSVPRVTFIKNQLSLPGNITLGDVNRISWDLVHATGADIEDVCHDLPVLFYLWKLPASLFSLMLDPATCQQLAESSQIDEYLEKWYLVGGCEKLNTLEAACGNKITIPSAYSQRCRFFSSQPPQGETSFSVTSPAQATVSLQTDSSETQDGNTSIHPYLSSAVSSFLRAFFIESSVRKNYLSHQQAKLAVNLIMLGAGILLRYGAIILSAMLSLLLDYAAPQNAFWPLALVFAGITHDLINGEEIADIMIQSIGHLASSTWWQFSGKILAQRLLPETSHNPTLKEVSPLHLNR